MCLKKVMYMTDSIVLPEELKELLEVETSGQDPWNTPIICRVEVDLPGWLKQLTGEGDWEVFDEEEDESCISFSLRESLGREKARTHSKTADSKLAEVTLYHNGYAVVNVDGKALFDGSLTTGTSQCAHLSYYNADSGEQILLN
ncbi:MAG TPA: hypothetical protein PLR90_06845 [Methylophilus sp.]|nr:hypothetical protein [Methylophilus sp.]HQQ33618.1 hypothetical protein [Methylophilus sp.]